MEQDEVNAEFTNLTKDLDGRIWQIYDCWEHAAELFGSDWEEAWCPICEEQYWRDQEG